MDLENQNVLITGAADGLGLAISKSFANSKANLFLIDINYDKLIENNISNAKNIKCDLSNINSLNNLITSKFSKTLVLRVLNRFYFLELGSAVFFSFCSFNVSFITNCITENIIAVVQPINKIPFIASKPDKILLVELMVISPYPRVVKVTNEK